VERFQQREVWTHLGQEDRATLQQQIAGLPSELPTDDTEARMFDLTALRLQLALAERDIAAFERQRRRAVEIAQLLEDKTSIPAVLAQAEYLAAIQQTEFWEGIGLAQLEELRLRLRNLVPFIDKKQRKVIYTSFQDEVLGVREEVAVAMPAMTGLQYEKKVKDYLTAHLDNIVIQRLRTNRPLTPSDLHELEATLVKIGADDGETLLSGLLERSGAPSLVHFVRGMVGMDRAAAQAAFSRLLSDRSLTATQIRFIELVIDQLTSRGVMDASALYEAPFNNLHADGPEGLFAGRANVIDGIFATLKALQPTS
jgi:type I restriction enzyme R subunit